MASPDRHFAAGALFTETAAPGTPNANDVWLYPKSDGRFYGKDDTGAEFAFGTIGGTTGTTDNVVPRANGTGGSTIQDSGLVVEDTVVSFAVTGDAATDVITATGSAFANDQPIRFTALTGGSGLNTTTNYYVINVSGATFQVSTSIGGSPSLFTTNITAGTLLTGHSVQVNVTLSENTTETNSALVLTPKGTGAFILGPKPDGTATGGNARGTNAVDLQISRGAANQVASGNSSVVIGVSNRIDGNTSFALGSANIAGSGAGQGTSIGWSNTSSGNTSIAIGASNTASATGALVVGGASSTAQSNYAAVVGGFGNIASSNYAFAIGESAGANRNAMFAHASGTFVGGVTGTAQRARFVLRNKTTTNAAVELFLDGSSTRLTIPSGKYLTGTINIAGIKSDGSAAASYIRQFSIKNVAGTTSLVGTVNTIGTDEAASTSISITANDTNDALKVEVTGITSEIWRWVAAVDVVEVAYGT